MTIRLHPDPEFLKILEASGGWPERADAIARRDAAVMCDVRCGDCWWFAPVGGCRCDVIRRADASGGTRGATSRRAYDCPEFDPVTFEPAEAPDDDPDRDPDEIWQRRFGQ